MRLRSFVCQHFLFLLCFLFCLLNGDKDRFIDFMKVLNLDLSFRAFSKSDQHAFLTMVKEYSELDYFIPAYLLFGLHGLDSLLSDLIFEELQRSIVHEVLQGTTKI